MQRISQPAYYRRVHRALDRWRRSDPGDQIRRLIKPLLFRLDRLRGISDGQ